MLKKKFLLISASCFLICSFTSFGQEIKDLRKLSADAEEYIRIEEYHNALPLYEQALKIEPDNGELNYKVGLCHLQSTYRAKALPYFEKALSVGYQPNEIHYNLGRLYHLTHHFDKALLSYEQAKKYPENAPVSVSEIDRYMDMCEYGKELIKTPLDYKIENIGPVINSDKRDHVPVVSADETTLIFTSRREGTIGEGIDDFDGMYFEDIYISSKENGQWAAPRNIGEVINTKSHDASVGLSPDGQKLFIYRTGQGSLDALEGNLYTSDWDGETWSTPEKMMEGINSGSVEPCASITADENTMYFSSDREGGKGGLDIYVVKKLPNGEWAQPQSVEQLNTPYDDDAPFIHSDNRTLYFSSKGHNTMGGFDIFMSVLNESTGQWSEPQNMGYPINTADDDIYFVWSADGERGYFSSLRGDSYGDLDIYVVHRPVIGKFFMILKGIVLDKDSKEPVTATVTIYDETDKKVVGVYNTRASTGKFSAIIPPNTKYKVHILASGYDEENEFIQTPDVKEYYEQEETFYVQRTVAASIDTIEDRPKTGEIFTLQNIYFDFDKATLRPVSKTTLDKAYDIMKKYPGIKVEIGAHTDAWGEDDYNMLLSGWRAKSVVDYLVAKGISRDRLVDKAYGESVPVAPSNYPENSQKNRRVEFKILESKR